METRYKMLTRSHPEAAAKLMEQAQQDVVDKWKVYEQLASANSEDQNKK
jgi:pyruvate-ferredoxin/flavodoxin oxidoreductase